MCKAHAVRRKSLVGVNALFPRNVRHEQSLERLTLFEVARADLVEVPGVTCAYQTFPGCTATVIPRLQCLRQLVLFTITRAPSPRSLTSALSRSARASEPFSPHEPLGFPGGRVFVQTRT